MGLVYLFLENVTNLLLNLFLTYSLLFFFVNQTRANKFADMFDPFLWPLLHVYQLFLLDPLIEF